MPNTLPRIRSQAGPLLPAALLAAFSFTLLLPSLNIGPISDDFAWLEKARLGQDMTWGQYLSQPAPFGYFRPLPLASFRLLWQAAGDHFAVYRLVLLAANSLLCLLIMLFLARAGFSRGGAFLGAAIFAALPGRAEALLWLCCLNELLSALLVAGGLYLFCFGRRNLQWLAWALFWLALLSRESALCFIPLAAFLKLALKKISWPRTAAAMVVPLACYAATRWWWAAVAGPQASAMVLNIDLNPLSMLVRGLGYLVKMLVPVKSLLELSGFDLYHQLREVLADPSGHPVAFLLSSLATALAGALLLWTLAKGGRAVLGALLFAGLALSVYLPFSGTAERFLYLPSVGVAAALAAALDRLKASRRPLYLYLALGLLSAYTVSLQNRIHRWEQVGQLTEMFYADLMSLVSESPTGRVYIENMPSTLYGVPYLSFYTINHGWRFHNPDKSLEIYSDPAPRPGEALGLIYNADQHRLKRNPR